LVQAKDKFPAAFDLGKLVDTRERRRIVGDFTLTITDAVAGRTYPDTIAKAASGYDTHGYVIDPFLLLRHPSRRTLTSYVPYRCLLAKGLEGIIVTGIALSAHRDAQPVVRMQPDIQNQGYAAGAAAAMASRAKSSIRKIDLRALQKHLVAIGNLPASVLSDADSFPLPDQEVAAAVPRILEDYRSAAVVMAHPQVAKPLLEEAYRQAAGDRQLLYAKVLAMLGSDTGLDTLLAELDQSDAWDDVPDWRIPAEAPGFPRVGWSMSHLDNTIVAIGRSRNDRGLPALLRRLSLLTPDTSFSHHRAVALALESLADRRAAQPLGELLRRPGMSGYAVTSIAAGEAPDSFRMQATRELMLARVLYRCGDWENLGQETLAEYARDLRGHFARHASAVLESKPASE